MNNNFQYQGERFADIQMLRYRLPGFEALSLNQKLYIYYLSEATLWGRDITFDQFGKYNLLIRSTLEKVYVEKIKGNCKADEPLVNKAKSGKDSNFNKFTEYLKRVWFSNGIYHHYGCEKFKPEFSQSFFEDVVRKTLGKDAEEILKQITPIIFNPNILQKRVNKSDNDDLIKTSACNYYENVSQQEVEDYYSTLSDKNDPEPPSYGLNSTLIKKPDGSLHEEVWRIGGKYSDIIEHIVENLSKASEYAENDQQRKIIALLIEYYKTGDLRIFDRYSIEWLKELEGNIDFINGFIEVYGDPLGIKASWEGIVEYKDLEACHRTQTICQKAQWFEDHSPVDPRFRKKVVKGVTANVICAAMLGGDEYPSTAIGINLPNADWIRAQHGSKSITISNITHAYNEAGKGNGFLDEFAIDKDVVAMVRKYGDRCDDLHTDLHECLGHGSGQLLPGTDPNALKNYSSTIEEARADLFGLYYIADPKLVELNLLDDAEAYKSQYYTYLMNGLLTQSVRIKLGDNIEEAHMRNRALIANWAYAHADGAMELVKHTEGDTTKTYLKINDYSRLRELFATLLAEIQRIKSEGDLEAARNIVETYGVKLNQDLHKEILDRYKNLNIAPYKGFLNPKLTLVKDGDTIKDVAVSYDETLDEQMLRYSREYSVKSKVESEK
jgi:dipeptidyl-peptidase-3